MSVSDYVTSLRWVVCLYALGRCREAIVHVGCWRVLGGWCGDLSNVNEAGLPGWGPGLVGDVCALVLLVRSAVGDRPCSIVLQSQEDDFAPLHGFQ